MGIEPTSTLHTQESISKLSCSKNLERKTTEQHAVFLSWPFHLKLKYTAYSLSSNPLNDVVPVAGISTGLTSLSIKQRELIYCCQLYWSYPCLTRRGDLGLLLPSNTTCRNQSPPLRGCFIHETVIIIARF